MAARVTNFAPLAYELREALDGRTSDDAEYGFVLVGSVALLMRGIVAPESVSDVDLILRPGLYRRLRERGWREIADAAWLCCSTCGHGWVTQDKLEVCPACEARGATGISHATIEPEAPWLEWDGLDRLPVTAASTLPYRDVTWRDSAEAFATSETACGWPCASLKLLRDWYEHAGRDKDKARIEAIDAFEARQRRRRKR